MEKTLIFRKNAHTLERNMQLPVWIIARYTYKCIGPL